MPLPDHEIQTEAARAAALAERFRKAVAKGTPSWEIDFKVFAGQDGKFRVAGLDFTPSHAVIVPHDGTQPNLLCTTFALHPDTNTVYRSALLQSNYGDTGRVVRPLRPDEAEAAVLFTEDPVSKLSLLPQATQIDQEEIVLFEAELKESRAREKMLNELQRKAS
jgi:hypothetical protein